jgi:hypothetical protein
MLKYEVRSTKWEVGSTKLISKKLEVKCKKLNKKSPGVDYYEPHKTHKILKNNFAF